MNLYEILRISKTATEEQIRKAYQELARRFHPDKTEKKDNDKFVKIDKAYKILIDPDSRRKYDSELYHKQSTHLIIHENVLRKQFIFDQMDVTYFHQCKCGSFYVLDNEDYNKTEDIILSCDECSLNILVKS